MTVDEKQVDDEPVDHEQVDQGHVHEEVAADRARGGWEHVAPRDEVAVAARAVSDARRTAAAAAARLAAASVAYARARSADDGPDHAPGAGPGRARRGEFVADELSLLLREQPFAVRWLLGRSRRLAADLPPVWAAFGRGDVDAEQVRVIDRAARRVTEAATLRVIDEQVVSAAQQRSPKQLAAWLLRLLVRCEPLAFQRRHQRALAERRVTVLQGADGMGYVTGEVSGEDAARIDGLLAAAARSLGHQDPRTEQQRRADLFADLLLGRLRLDEDDPYDDRADGADGDGADSDASGESGRVATAAQVDAAVRADDWLEIEDIDPDTGELLGVRRERLDAAGRPTGETAGAAGSAGPAGQPPAIQAARPRRPRTLRIGVVVPLSSLLGVSDAPGELADRSGLVPGETLRRLIAETSRPDATDRVLFTRLLTDDGGRLLHTTELGRHASARLAEAVKLRAGTCTFPTCTVPADRCDLDHHQPWPRGHTRAANLDPKCRRHHRAKTFAWLATTRDDGAVEWTMPDANRYRCADEPLPVGPADPLSARLHHQHGDVRVEDDALGGAAEQQLADR